MSKNAVTLSREFGRAVHALHNPAPVSEAVQRVEALHRWLDEHLDDWQVRLVLADALGEAGGEFAGLAAGYRALGRLRLYPAVHPEFAVWGGTCHPSNNGHDQWSRDHSHLLLPTRWFRAMPFCREQADWETEDRPIWKRQPSRRESENAAARAYRPEFEEATKS